MNLCSSFPQYEETGDLKLSIWHSIDICHFTFEIKLTSVI